MYQLKFFVDTKKKEKKKKKNCTKSNVSLQIQSNNEKKILHLIEASFKNYKKDTTDHLIPLNINQITKSKKKQKIC